MDFSLSDEQQQLKDSLKRYLDKTYTFEERRRQLASGEKYSRKHWAAFAEFGLLGIGMPEACGGLGANTNAAEDIMVVMECFGRSMVVEPYVSTVVLCGGLIRDTGSESQQQALLPDLIAGTTSFALAAHERAARYRLRHVKTKAIQEGESYFLSGEKSVCLHGDSADRLLVSARTKGATDDESGIALFVVDANAPGVSMRGYPTFDGLRAADIAFDNVRIAASARLGDANNALPALERAIDHGVAALCAEAVGAMDVSIEQTLEYIKNRKQFGAPIGSFQVLQHRMTDMYIAVEQARSMSMLCAIKAGSESATERRKAISAAKSIVGQSARYVGQQAVQLHGGMGVTDALPISHYFKRLTAIDMTFGDASYHRGLFSDLIAAE